MRKNANTLISRTKPGLFVLKELEKEPGYLEGRLAPASAAAFLPKLSSQPNGSSRKRRRTRRPKSEELTSDSDDDEETVEAEEIQENEAEEDVEEEEQEVPAVDRALTIATTTTTTNTEDGTVLSKQAPVAVATAIEATTTSENALESETEDELGVTTDDVESDVAKITAMDETAAQNDEQHFLPWTKRRKQAEDSS
jgi:hypothetical protein